MSLIADVVKKLKADPKMIAAIPASKVFRGIAPKDTPFPYVCVFLISENVDFLTGFKNIRLQFSVWAKTDSEADSIADVIFNILQGFNGDLNIYRSEMIDRSDDYDSTVPLYSVQIDFKFIIREEVYLS